MYSHRIGFAAAGFRLELVVVASTFVLAMSTDEQGMAALQSEAVSPFDTDDSTDSEAWHEASDWIELLGSSDFRQRELSQARLEEMGSAAFDALFASREHGDLEVRLAIRDLLSRVEIEWVDAERDSAEVRMLLTGYGQLSHAEKISRIEELSRLQTPISLVPLIRIARFEQGSQRAKLAALKLLESIQEPAPFVETGAVESIVAELGPSTRTSVHWIRMCADSLSNREWLTDSWRQAIDQEVTAYGSTTERGMLELSTARGFVRWYLARLYDEQRGTEANRLFRKAFVLWEGDRNQVIELLDFFTGRGEWGGVQVLVEQFPQVFAEDAFLLYHLAEVHAQSGEDELATEFAGRAEQLSGDDGRKHVEMAAQLRERGMHRWALLELHRALACTKIGSVPDVDARILLARYHEDREEYRQAAVLFDDLWTAMQSDQAVERDVNRKRASGTIRGLCSLFWARYHAAQNDTQSAWERLQTAIDADPTNPNIIIEMYRQAADQTDRLEETQTRIARASGFYLGQIRLLEGELLELGGGWRQELGGKVVGRFTQ